MIDSNVEAKGAIREFARKFKLPEITVTILYNRGFCTEDQLQAFLYPQLSMLPAPDSMNGTPAEANTMPAASRLARIRSSHASPSAE